MTEQAYLNLLDDIMKNGVVKTDRTGTGTKSLFGKQLRFDLSKGFPLITTKKVHFKSIVAELLWFLSGSTNIKYLVDNDVHLWNDWPLKHFNQFVNKQAGSENDQELALGIAQGMVEDGNWKTINPDSREFGKFISQNKNMAVVYGDLGPVYGYQWRYWPAYWRDPSQTHVNHKSIDQIKKSIEMLKMSPDSRRNIVSAWNVADIEEMAVSGLPPCHFAFQWNTRPMNYSERVECWYDPQYFKPGEDHASGFLSDERLNEDNIPDRKLDCHVNIRSWDTFLGGPFNIASYALLIHLYAKQVNMVPGELIISSGDTHIYSNHENAVREQLSRTLYDFCRLLPLPDKSNIFDYKLEDIQLLNYQSHPVIKAPIAV